MPKRRLLLAAPLAAGALEPAKALQDGLPDPVRMAGSEEAGDQRFTYAQRLLVLALERAGVRIRMEAITGLKQRRQVRELEQGYLDVGLLASNLAETPTRALPVRVPIRGGLLGVRLLVAREQTASRLATCESLRQLAQSCRFGHGADWADLGTMRSAGLHVLPLPGYQRLFDALRRGEVDALSRSVAEVWDELANPTLAGGLVPVPRLALYYPLDDFLWVNPRRPELAEAIAAGLRRARADGSHQALFKTHYGAALARAQLASRTVFRLVEAKTPLDMPDPLFDGLNELQLAGVGA